MSLSGLRILIGDDHVLIREGLKRILLDGGHARHVGEAADAVETMAAVRREKWSLVILDINLGGRNGVEVLKEIKAEFPSQRVLMLSSYPEEQFALRVIRAGASGYLNKNLAGHTLIEAVHQVMTSGRYISPKVAEQLANAVQQPADAPLHTTLSNREDQVLRLIAAGHTVGEIARQLDLSVKTVSTYRGIVLRKLSLENNAQLMRYAQDHGLS
jgi:two-component system, NarL family, invasion response regulator UvrY